jgi:hypothetical protein
MQDNTTRGFSTWPMGTLDGHVFEQLAFYTQIPYNLCHHIVKILLQSYLELPSPPTVSRFYKY